MKKFITIFACIILTILSVSTIGCTGKIIRISQYEITCQMSDDYVLCGNEKITFYNDEEVTISHLKFNLYPNAFRKDAKYSPISAQYQGNAYPNGISYGDVQITGVVQNGTSLEYTIEGEDKNILTVNLLTEIYPDECVTVEIAFIVKLANVVARTGYNGDTVNLGNFYPILCVYDDGGFYECLYYANGDPFYSECADYLVDITLNEEYVLAGGGKKTAITTKDGLSTHTFRLKNARSFASVASKKFNVITKTMDGIMVNYYYFKDQSPNENFNYITESLSYFSKTFGDYAYTDYTVCETPFVQGGMEYPTLVMISDKLEPSAYGEVIVHETAHQWWQTAVGNNEILHAFMDEGLTEYSVVLFYENHPQYGMTRQKMIKSAEQTYKTYCTIYDKIFGNVDTKMIRSLNEFESEYEYVNIAYIKACIMFDYLRESIGDTRFFSGLKKYYDTYKYKIASPYDLVGIFEKTGADSNGFFESFYQGKVIL